MLLAGSSSWGQDFWVQGRHVKQVVASEVMIRAFDEWPAYAWYHPHTLWCLPHDLSDARGRGGSMAQSSASGKVQSQG